MSPDAYVCFDKSRRLLCGFPGQSRLEEPTYVWSYSDFEDWVGESITPSMYYFFIDHVEGNISKDDLWDIQCDEYGRGDLESAAVDAYYDLPINERIRMHEHRVEVGVERHPFWHAEGGHVIDPLRDLHVAPLRDEIGRAHV